MSEQAHFKDEGLNKLSTAGYNVAQFVSYTPTAEQRFSRLKGIPQNHTFASQRAAVDFMLFHTTEHSVNVRSFDPYDPKSKPFAYGLSTTAEVLAQLEQRRDEGLHTIVNETVDIDDGGVSGVAFGNIIEFAPHDTPRCVEKPGTAQFTRSMGADIIRKVYGFYPDLADNPETRIEFSVHPLRHGYQDTHTIIWEAEHASGAPLVASTQWPNRMSDMLGDKTLGLLVADSIGLRIPRTTVFNRSVAPFSFGTTTDSKESWLRTAPNKQTPGLYTTTKGWIDPFALLQREDPSGENIASVIQQEGIDATYSGACIMGADGSLLIEGTDGTGDAFMVGEQGIRTLPPYLESAVKDTYKQASDALGPVRFEWVYDGVHVWVVQLHRGVSASTREAIYPGDDETAYIEYDTANGIDGLRLLIGDHVPGTGITLLGDVGVTSHFGDLLRKSAIPSRIKREG